MSDAHWIDESKLEKPCNPHGVLWCRRCLEAELAHSQAREAALVAAVVAPLGDGRMSCHACHQISFSKHTILSHGFGCPFADISPAAKALLDRAERGDRAHNDREFLFQLLDNIDTIDDMAKGDDAAYRRLAQKQQKKRFERADTDGYSVTWKGDAVLAKEETE